VRLSDLFPARDPGDSGDSAHAARATGIRSALPVSLDAGAVGRRRKAASGSSHQRGGMAPARAARARSGHAEADHPGRRRPPSTATDAGPADPDITARGNAGAGSKAGAEPPNGPDSSCEAGPPYESLFGNDGDATRQRPKRERKPATALQRALGLLTRREHSRKELIRKLVSRGVDAAEVETAVDKLANAGWQDERRFAESLVRSRAANGYGPLHIRAELGTHDLPAEVREAALDDFDGDWAALARDAVTRRFARVGDPRLRERKAADYLVRRGFPADVVRAAARFSPED
jgi:regulatory protein